MCDKETNVEGKILAVQKQLSDPLHRARLKNWLNSCGEVARSTNAAYHARQALYRAAKKASFPSPDLDVEQESDESITLGWDSYLSLLALATYGLDAADVNEF